MTKVKCDIPKISVLGSTILRISGGTSSIKPHYYEKEIVSLEFKDGKVISRGEKFKIGKKEYKINIIEKKKIKNITYYNLKTATKTKSSLFIAAIFTLCLVDVSIPPLATFSVTMLDFETVSFFKIPKTSSELYLPSTDGSEIL